jgi:hypothetical protein
MPRTKIGSILRSTTGVLALSITFLVSSSNLRAQAGQTPAIVGSWILTLPPDPEKAGSRSSRFILAFSAEGGGLLGDKPNNGPGILAWKQVADRQFAFTVISVIYGNAGAGTPINDIGTQKIRGVATLNGAGDALVLTITGQALTLDGTVLDSFSATVNAARVQVEPL